MKIETKFFGVVEIDDTQIIEFAHGIPGFENDHHFAVLKNDDSPFHVLQSVERAGLAFIIIELGKVVPDYEIDLPEEVVTELKLEKPEEALVCAIVVLPCDISQATVNLAAPLVINVKEKRGVQIILNNPAYGIKHPLFSPVQDLKSAK
jgi:flagellar assembly factor FliW